MSLLIFLRFSVDFVVSVLTLFLKFYIILSLQILISGCRAGFGPVVEASVSLHWA